METISMADLMWKLPLFDNLFLSMQGQNIMLVDVYLRDLERTVYHEYLIKEDRNPTQVMFLSGLSQMWVFAAYELLRTWRQFAGEIQSDASSSTSQNAPPTEIAEAHWRSHVEQARSDPQFVKDLDKAYEAVEPIFRRIEALRMNLAKHEVKGKKDTLAIAPGYARLDEGSGSIMWMVDLGNKNIELVSRLDLANHLREVVIGRLLDQDEDEEV